MDNLDFFRDFNLFFSLYLQGDRKRKVFLFRSTHQAFVMRQSSFSTLTYCSLILRGTLWAEMNVFFMPLTAMENVSRKRLLVETTSTVLRNCTH